MFVSSCLHQKTLNCTFVKVGKDLLFVATLISALGAIITGTLALHNVTFFASMGKIGAYTCLAGGSGTALFAIILKSYALFREKLSPPQPDSTDPIPIAKSNNLLPEFTIYKLNLNPEEMALKLSDGARKDLSSFPSFYHNSQTDFHKKCIEYLRSESFSTKHLQSLREERNTTLGELHIERPLVTTIIGGGLAGLVSALEAYLAGATVHLVEKQVKYSRDTMVHLHPGIKAYLKDRLKEFMTIAESQRVIVNRLHRFYDREVLQEDSFSLIEIKALEWMISLILYKLANEDEELKIYRESEFDRIEGKNVILKGGSHILTDWIIGADGAKSLVRKSAQIKWETRSTSRRSVAATFPNLWGNNNAYWKLNNRIPQSITEAVEQEDLSKSSKKAKENFTSSIGTHITASKWKNNGDPRYKHYCNETHVIEKKKKRKKFTFFKKEKKSDQLPKEIILAKEGERKLLPKLKKLGWEQEQLPNNRLFVSTHTLFLGTDLPQNISDKEIKPWISTTLEQNFPRPTIDILLAQLRNVSVFNTELFEAVSVVKEGRIFLLGDASGIPDFQTGYGAQKAIRDARAFGNLVKAYGKQDNFQTVLSKYKTETKKRTRDLHQKSFDAGLAELRG